MELATNSDEFVWAEKYRPKRIEDVIIPARIKTGLLRSIADGQIPNMTLFSASPGTGKTTTAKAICESLGIRPLYINASKNTGIDTVRMQVVQYATTTSVFEGSNIKVVILDEADRLSTNAQDSLKGVIEESSSVCRFILTVNSTQRLIEPILSRCPVMEFTFGAEEQKQVTAMMFKRCAEILDAEGIPYSKPVLAQIVARYSPDNRALLLRLQEYAGQYGEINEGALTHVKAAEVQTLVAHMAAKDFPAVKQWCFANQEVLHEGFYRQFLDCLGPVMDPQSTPEAIVTVNDYQNNLRGVPDRFLHFLSLSVTLMMSLKFRPKNG